MQSDQNAKNGAKTGKSKFGLYSRTPEETKFIEETVGRIWSSNNNVVLNIMEACKATLASRAQRTPNNPKINTTVSEEQEAVAPKSPTIKWHSTEFGKSLKVHTHIATKVEKSIASPALVIAWKNVQGPVGAAIGRARRKSLPDEEVRAILNELNFGENVTPQAMIAEIGTKFPVEGQVALSSEAKAARKTAQKAAKEEKRKGKSQT